MKKSIFTLFFIVTLTSSAFAGDCQYVARKVGSGASTHSSVTSVSLKKCIKNASEELSASGYNKTALKFTESDGTLTVLEIKNSTAEAFENFYRHDETNP
ncbi:MAG: hypothetical protein HYW49_08495 [Deltaproteobacteria bacterium]|nr:hypothetical protein [Deltaproteobacteria bacterium]